MCSERQVGLFGYEYNNTKSLGPEVTLATFSFNFVRFIPITAFAYGFQFAVLPIYLETKNHSPQLFASVLRWAVGLATFSYIVVGTFGLSRFLALCLVHFVLKRNLFLMDRLSLFWLEN
jgi:amino acid permease